MNGSPRMMPLLLDSQWMGATVGEMLSLHAALRHRRIHTTKAAEHSRKGLTGKLAFEAQLLAQEREAEQAVTMLGTKALRFMQHIHHGGLLHVLFSTISSGLKEEGTVSVSGGRLLEELPDLLPREGESGLTAGDIDEMRKTMEGWAAALHFEGNDCLLANWKDRKEQISLELPPRPDNARSIVELLEINKFDAVTGNADRPGAIAGDIIFAKSSDGGVVPTDPCRIFLAGVGLAVNEQARRVRDLEDIGLPQIQGGDIAIVVVVLVAAIVATVFLALKLKECVEEGGSGSRCFLIALLAALGMIAAAQAASDLGSEIKDAVSGLSSSHDLVLALNINGADLPRLGRQIVGGM